MLDEALSSAGDNLEDVPFGEVEALAIVGVRDAVA